MSDWLGVHNEQTQLRQENEILNHAVLALTRERDAALTRVAMLQPVVDAAVADCAAREEYGHLDDSVRVYDIDLLARMRAAGWAYYRAVSTYRAALADAAIEPGETAP